MADLSTFVASKLRAGWRVEGNVGNGVALVKGRRPNHLLHFVISIFTFGCWIVVWAMLAVFTGEKRMLVQQGPDGVARRVSGGLHPATTAIVVLLGVWIIGAAIAGAGREKRGESAPAISSTTTEKGARAATARSPQRQKNKITAAAEDRGTFARQWLALPIGSRKARAALLEWEQVDALPAAQMLPEEMARWSELNAARTKK